MLKRKIEMRKIDSLQAHPKQNLIFKPQTEQEREALAENIKRNGLLNPVEITPDGVIICGHGRVEAMQLLGKEEIQCWVRDDLAAAGYAAIVQRMIEDNVDRRQLGRLARARAYTAMKNAMGERYRGEAIYAMRDTIGKQFGVSGRSLERWKRMLKAPMSVQDAWDDKKISTADVEAVLACTKKVQKKIGEQIEAGENPKTVIRDLAAGTERSVQVDLKRNLAGIISQINRVHAETEAEDGLRRLHCLSFRVPDLRASAGRLNELIEKLALADEIECPDEWLSTWNSLQKKR